MIDPLFSKLIMNLTEQQIDQAFSDLKKSCGGVREDYFGLLYVENTLHIPREDAQLQVAFGGNDYGLDGYHLDPESRNLYLFQFKWSANANLFASSFERLIESGMTKIFGNSLQDAQQNQLLLQLRRDLFEKKDLVSRVLIHFVFKGDPVEAERSKLLERLREDLEGKKYLIDEFFGRPVDLAIEFRSTQTRKAGMVVHHKITHTYPMTISKPIMRLGPGGEEMSVGFIRLWDLIGIFRGMGQRFFERNIRAGLSEDEAPNRAISRSLNQIILEGKVEASMFAFNHNGVTISAEKLEQAGDIYRVTEPRLLNGAQTVTTFSRFLDRKREDPRLVERQTVIEDIWVLCRIITKATPEFIVEVTINNNRQNPVKPWALRANDMIQLRIGEKFRDDLAEGIYYARQEGAFENLSNEDLEALEISQRKPIELRRLALTFLASDGDVDKMNKLGEVFETDKSYTQVFNEDRLRADTRQILLCYKINFRLNKLIQEIESRGASRYFFARKARNLVWALVCQGMLNDKQLEDYAERFGKSMAVEVDYTNWVSGLAANKVRFLLKDLVEESPYAEKISIERYDFLKSKAVFDRCMEIAWKKWRWVKKSLK